MRPYNASAKSADMHRNVRLLLGSSIFIHMGLNILAPVYAIYPNVNTLSDSSTRCSRSIIVEREQTAPTDCDRLLRQLPHARI